MLTLWRLFPVVGFKFRGDLRIYERSVRLMQVFIAFYYPFTVLKFVHQNETKRKELKRVELFTDSLKSPEGPNISQASNAPLLEEDEIGSKIP